MRFTPSGTVDHINLNRTFQRPSSSHEERIFRRNLQSASFLRKFCLGSIFDFFDMVVLINAHQRHDWLIGAVTKRLREEFAKLQVEINDEKSRIVDLERSESFGFLGFDFRYIRSRRGVMRPHYTPKLKKRKALLRELKEVFRRHRSQPVGKVTHLINQKLRGWVNYFEVGHSSECFSYIKHWWNRRSGAIWRGLGNERASAGIGGVVLGYTTLSNCITVTGCDMSGRKLPQQDRPHKP